MIRYLLQGVEIYMTIGLIPLAMALNGSGPGVAESLDRYRQSFQDAIDLNGRLFAEASLVVGYLGYLILWPYSIRVR